MINEFKGFSFKMKYLKIHSLFWIFILYQYSFSQNPSVEFIKNEKWHGFERESFMFNNYEARIVKPGQALEGNP